jgi:hypothetical protein
MATPKTTDSGANRFQTTADADNQREAAVLRRVLEIHPETFTKGELLREMTGGGSTEFSEADANERAVRDLAAAGLIHPPEDDEIVRPTRAAIRFFELAGTAG